MTVKVCVLEIEIRPASAELEPVILRMVKPMQIKPTGVCVAGFSCSRYTVIVYRGLIITLITYVWISVPSIYSVVVAGWSTDEVALISLPTKGIYVYIYLTQ